MAKPISPFLHGCLDYAVAALLAGTAARAPLAPQIRRTLAAASAGHASYAAATDYQLGLRPWIGMRTHLALDAAAAAALIGTGLLLRRTPPAQRALLVGIGLAEFGIVALSRPDPHDHTHPHGEVAYPPLDVPKPVSSDIWIVDSELPGPIGRVVPIRMTVIRLPDRSLLLHSPTRLTPALRAALQRLGPVAHLVAPNIAHWTMLQEWQRAFPQAATWAAPGLRQRRQVKKSGVQLDHDIPSRVPPAWGDSLEIIMLPGGFGFHEAALFHHPSRTLVLTDLVLNLEPEKVPSFARPLVRLFGSVEGGGMPPPYLRAVIKLRRTAAAAAASRMLALQPERVLFAHGKPFERDATNQLRHALRWLLH